MMVSNTVKLSPAQIKALKALVDLSPIGSDVKRSVVVEQTYTYTGGTHLYINLGVGPSYHIAASGNIARVEDSA